MNSWRRSSVMCPTRVRKPIPASHSSVVRRTSRAKACRCRVRLSSTSRSRSSFVPAKLATTSSVTACSRFPDVVVSMVVTGPPAPRRADQPLQRSVPDRDGVVLRHRRLGERGGLLDPVFGHPQRAQPPWDAVLVGERPQPRDPVGDAQRPGDPSHRVRRARGVERQDVREDDGVGAGVRQVERPAQHVAELVVQTRAGHGERRRAEPRAAQQLGRVVLAESGRQPPDRLLGDGRADGVAPRRPHRLDGVGERVEPARGREIAGSVAVSSGS